MSEGHNEAAKWRGTGMGLLATVALGLAVGLVAPFVLWQWPAEAGGLGFVGIILSGVLIGGAIGLFIGGTLAWNGSGFGSTLDRGESAPLYGVLTGIVLGGSLAPVVGAVLGLAAGQLLGGALLGVVLGPLVGIAGWQAGYWAADFHRGTHHDH